MSEPLLQFGNFHHGQSAFGKLDYGRMFSTKNLDIHTTPGMAQPQKKLTVFSEEVNEPCWTTTSNYGIVWLCSKTSGKIWKFENNLISLVHTNTNGSHQGCHWFNGCLWYWTDYKLGYFRNTWNDTFANLDNARSSVEANNSLLIGNGRRIARIDASNRFSDNELILPAHYTVSSLANIGDDVLIGTYVYQTVSYCRVFLWDTVSKSWLVEDEMDEAGLNTFIPLDNVTLAQCGNESRFYYWNGSSMRYFGKIRGERTVQDSRLSTVYKGRALFAVGNKIYSIHASDGQNYAFCCEYTTPAPVAAMFTLDDRLFVVAGKLYAEVNQYETAELETPEVQAPVSRITIAYDQCPEGVELETKIQNGEYKLQKLINEDTGRYLYFDGGLGTNAVCQAKVRLKPVGSKIPAIKKIIFE